MARFSTREVVAAAALALGLAGNAALYALVVQPLAEAQREQHRRLLNLQGNIRALHEQGRTLEAQLRALRDLEDLRGQFPERHRIVRVSEELARVAERLHLKLPGITYQPEPVQDLELLRVKLTLGVEGRYEQVRLFLLELEKRRRHLVVERMGLTEQRGGQAQAGHVAMQLSLAGYFR